MAQLRTNQLAAIATLRISEGGSNLVVIDTSAHRYHGQVRGFVELQVDRPAEPRLNALNIVIEPTGGSRSLPGLVHLAADSASEAQIAGGASAGRLESKVRLEYPGQSPRHLIFDPPAFRVGAGAKPRLIPFTATWLPVGRRHRLYGTLRVPHLRPFLDSAAIIHIICDLSVVNGNLCGELCLNVVVASFRKGPVISSDDVKKLVKRADEIWGCSRPKQCCIRITVENKNITVIRDIANELALKIGAGNKLDEASSNRVNRLLNRYRSKRCWNVYLLSRLETIG